MATRHEMVHGAFKLNFGSPWHPQMCLPDQSALSRIVDRPIPAESNLSCESNGSSRLMFLVHDTLFRYSASNFSGAVSLNSKPEESRRASLRSALEHQELAQ